MSRTSELARSVWLYLLQNGGRYTAAEIAQATGQESMEVFNQLSAMSVRGLVQDYEPDVGERRKRYGITGTCGVPQGLKVAEVQVC